MTYKLVKNPFTGEVDQVRLTTDTSNIQINIPFAPDNTSYQEYLEWAKTNTAEPAD